MEIERYSDIKDKIELRVVDMEIHGKELEHLASVRLGGGMYATFQVVVDRNEVAKISIPLTNDLASELGCNAGIVLQDAAENMVRNDPTTLVSLDEVMRTMMFQDNKERMRLDRIESLPDKSQIYVLSNESTFGGAFTFWIGDTKKELGRLLENNYYVLPSSNHELLIIPDSKEQCARDLGQMVRDVNNAIVDQKDLLSYKVNKEIRDYTESMFFGLSMRQFVSSLLACSAAVGSYFAFKPILGTEITSWICMLFAAPFAAIGFVKYNGMPAEKFIVAFIRSQLRIPKVLVMKNGCYYYEEPQQKKKRPVPNRELTFIKHKTKKKDKKRKEKKDD